MTATADLAVNWNKCTLNRLLDSQHTAWILQLNSSGFLGFFFLQILKLHLPSGNINNEFLVLSLIFHPKQRSLWPTALPQAVSWERLWHSCSSLPNYLRRKRIEILFHLVSGKSPTPSKGRTRNVSDCSKSTERYLTPLSIFSLFNNTNAAAQQLCATAMGLPQSGCHTSTSQCRSSHTI